MHELFNEANVPYNLCQDVNFRSYNAKTVLYGTALLYFGPKIWNLVPFNIRDCATNFLPKDLKNGNQIDIYVGSAKYTFLS